MTTEARPTPQGQASGSTTALDREAEIHRTDEVASSFAIETQHVDMPGWSHEEPLHRELLEALGVAVYTTDADGRITFYNEAAAAFWGRRPELGELWCGSWRLFWPDGRPMASRRTPAPG